jgi:predicted nuclease of restriction endonuclease-like (RecB) superfamily
LSKEISRLDETYLEFIAAVKAQIQTAQVKAGLAVNRELVMLYWRIGRMIGLKQKQSGWGGKVIKQIATDLKKAFPEMKGFSERNLQYMRTFAETYPDEQFTQELPAQITWYHNCTILDKITNQAEREFYIQQTIQHGWSRNVLVHQIESKVHQRQGQASTNFTATLPAPQSDLARQVLKDPYNFDFLTLTTEVQERELERALIKHIREFLLELGAGFAFVGSQYPLEVGDQDFFIDLLFYHIKLRCFVAVDLKVGDFQPEYVGKMNFYLSALDHLLRHPSDQPSIGIILCKTKNKVIAEYALKDYTKPIGIAEYQLTRLLPADFKDKMPTIEELEAELDSQSPPHK